MPSCPRHLMPSIRLGVSTTRLSQTSATKKYRAIGQYRTM